MSGKKILISGAGGMLGSAMAGYFGKRWSVTAADSGKMDITSRDQVRRVVEDESPEILIHAAAYTDVDGCERERDRAYLVNTLGTANLVECCIDTRTLFVYISSTGVYGRRKEEPYSEFDHASPDTVHHRSKYEAEKIIKDHLERFLILRTGWLFGGHAGHAKNFVYKRYLEAESSDIIYSDDSQKGSPTFVEDLAAQTEYLLEKERYGLFNCVNRSGGVTRYEYVKKIVEIFGLNCRVEKAGPDMFKRAAPVSPNESAVNYKLDLLGMNLMGEWESSLEKYIEKLRESLR